jgi:ATP-binding cassette subfamily B protein
MYRKSDYPLKKAQGENQFIAGSPRYAMESVSMIFIAIFAYVLINQSNTIISVIPILGTFAIGAQRMLPVLQQAYAALTNIRGSKESLKDVVDLLNQPLPNYLMQEEYSPITFNKEITLDQVYFNYKSNNSSVLQNINLKIKKGGKIGFVGSTGSGKSTLLDIIMGLLVPIKGQMLIDSISITAANAQSWQKNIAHVPQAIFLSDDSIEANIAFGIPQDRIDINRIKKVAKEARLDKLIEAWPDKYKTFVGERGARLSGGQRQRIGIARALYKQASVIILDEATSALDSKTESQIMNTIGSLDESITVLIIAHRTTTLKNCDQIVELKDGEIINIYNSWNEYNE